MEEGGGSSSSGPAVLEDVEESALVKKLVAPSAPTADDREDTGVLCSELGVASDASDVANCISIVPVEERPRFQRLPLTTVILNERDDMLQETAGAPILVSNRDRWIGAAIVPTKGADEYAGRTTSRESWL